MEDYKNLKLAVLQSNLSDDDKIAVLDAISKADNNKNMPVTINPYTGLYPINYPVVYYTTKYVSDNTASYDTTSNTNIAASSTSKS